MSLRLKFVLVLMLFCVGVGINIYAAIWANRVLLAEATTAFHAADQAGSSVEYLRQTLNRQASDIRDMVAASRLGSVDRSDLNQQCAMLTSESSRLVDSALEEDLVADVRAMRAEMDAYVTRVRSTLIESEDAEDPEAARAALLDVEESLQAANDSLDDRLQQLEINLVQARHQSTGSMVGGSQTVNLILIAMAMLEFVVLMVVLSLFRNWIIEPIAEISVATSEIASGNLGYRLEQTRGDELGALAVEVNHMAESLNHALRDLKQSERMAAVGEMVSVVAHNIRNPLAGIRATAQAAMHEAPGGSQARVLQQRIIDSVDSLEQWLKELLHLNRPLELNLEATPLDELVGDLQLIFKPTLERRKVDIDYKPNQPEQLIHVDRQHFTQAMASIIDNAIEASPAGSRVQLRAGAINGRFRIEVADSGNGIPEGLYKQVFESYFSTKPGGTGIGLSMAKKIIEAHSGELSVVGDGNKDCGATFRIDIKNKPKQTGGVDG